MFYAPTYCPGGKCDPCAAATFAIIGGAYYQGTRSAVAFSIGSPPAPPDDEAPPGPSIGQVTCKISIKDSHGTIVPGPTISGPIFWQGASTGVLAYLGLAPLAETAIDVPDGFNINEVCALLVISGSFNPSYDCCIMPIRNGVEGSVDLPECS